VTAKVHRLRPKQHDVVTEAMRLILDMPLGLGNQTRDELAEALGKFAPPETWTYTMVSPGQLQRILAAINAGPDSGNVLRVWTAVMCFVQYGTNEIMAGRAKIAETAGIRSQEVSRAMTRLTEIGALVRLRPGRYAINPHVGWCGDLVKRQEAAKAVPPIRAVEPDSVA
jgi:Firmicute plasmid replication protein (RepL)